MAAHRWRWLRSSIALIVTLRIAKFVHETGELRPLADVLARSGMCERISAEHSGFEDFAVFEDGGVIALASDHSHFNFELGRSMRQRIAERLGSSAERPKVHAQVLRDGAWRELPLLGAPEDFFPHGLGGRGRVGRKGAKLLVVNHRSSPCPLQAACFLPKQPRPALPSGASRGSERPLASASVDSSARQPLRGQPCRPCWARRLDARHPRALRLERRRRAAHVLGGAPAALQHQRLRCATTSPGGALASCDASQIPSELAADTVRTPDVFCALASRQTSRRRCACTAPTGARTRRARSPWSSARPTAVASSEDDSCFLAAHHVQEGP